MSIRNEIIFEGYAVFGKRDCHNDDDDERWISAVWQFVQIIVSFEDTIKFGKCSFEMILVVEIVKYVMHTN